MNSMLWWLKTGFVTVLDGVKHMIYFGVKFYSADPCKLHEEITRYESGFPLRLENLENGKAFSSQGILNRLEKSGECQGKSHKILEN